MYKKFFIVLTISIITVVCILWFLLTIIDKNIRRKKSDAIYISRSKSIGKNKLIAMYQFFSRFPITRGYMNRITRRYEILCPSEKKEISVKSMIFALSTWLICGTIMVLIYVRKPSIYHACITVFLVWIANSSMVSCSVRRGETRILKQLDMFLSDIRHFYYISGAVDEAILEAMELAGKEMKVHANKIYEILTSENMSEEVIKYNETTQNNYLKMFLAQCVSAIDYGDKKVKEESLFLSNIKNLKTDIIVELIKLNKIKFLFLGINAMIVTPVLFLDAIRKWAVSNIPELINFYYGKNGIILMIVIFMQSVILYTMVGYLKETHTLIKKDYSFYENISNLKIIKIPLDNYMKKHYGKIEQQRITLKKMGENITPKQLMVKRLLYAFIAVIIGTLVFLNLHALNRHNILHQVNDVEQISAGVDDRQLEYVKDTITTYVNKYKNKERLIEKTIENELLKSNIFKNKMLVISVSEKIVDRIHRYQEEYLKWYEVLLIIFIGFMAYHFPYLMILFRKSIMRMNMNDEVIQFQSIILMLMYIDQMTVSKILEFMEAFAVIFKDSIRTCLNDYDSGDIEALNDLKYKEKFIPFQRLVDNFLISDKIGLELAFDEIAVERANFIEQRKQDNEINITNKGTLAKYIGYFHFVLVIVTYLAIPFITESLIQFQNYNLGMNNLS